MSTYKVTYFNGRGRGELTRLLLVAAGQEFEDERVTREEWQKLKPNMPQGTLPVLTVNDKMVPQSGAINRHLARKLDLYGKTNEEMTTNDIVMETVNDFRNTLVRAHFEQDDTKKTELFKNIKEQTVPNFVNQMENVLCENNDGSGFFVGSSITVGDLAILDVMEVVVGLVLPSALDQSEKLKAHRDRVSNSPRIKEWLETRPRTDM
ncbi:glutathione S-transferase 3-like [Mytilus trossulus]|uniref:glutathione S-transferase 3-like n=1 Tax=Mytilus trossulus TaxID=6551 RepID=UPI003003F374